MKRVPLETKMEAVRRVILGEKKSIAAEHGITPKTLRKWVLQLRKGLKIEPSPG